MPESTYCASIYTYIFIKSTYTWKVLWTVSRSKNSYQRLIFHRCSLLTTFQTATVHSPAAKLKKVKKSLEQPENPSKIIILRKEALLSQLTCFTGIIQTPVCKIHNFSVTKDFFDASVAISNHTRTECISSQFTQFLRSRGMLKDLYIWLTLHDAWSSAGGINTSCSLDILAILYIHRELGPVCP